MRANRAQSGDLHAGRVVGARVVSHPAPTAFSVPQGCLVCGAPLFASSWCLANASGEETNTCIRMFKLQCGMYSHVRNAMWIVSAHSHSM